MICANTEREAQQRRHRILDHGDTEAAENFMSHMAVQSQSYEETLKRYRDYFITSGGGIPLIGTAEQVAEKMIAISEAGFDGLALGFFDYYDDMVAFNESVMPLLREAGIHT